MRDIIDEIRDKLLQIEEQEQVSILLAVESGSRAWGFASPDSDYDVRFIYVRKQEDYLALNPPGDVIEWQLDDVLDINGWDLRKALLQFRRGNATLFEWSNSPVVYRKTPLWEKIYDRLKIYFSEKAAVYHYYGTAKSTLEGYLQQERVKYKKYFYALRPLLACRYIEQYHKIPPVLFDELLKMELPDDLRNEMDTLIKIKTATGEGQLNPSLPVITDFIISETGRQKQLADEMTDDRHTEWDTLNDVFLAALTKRGERFLCPV